MNYMKQLSKLCTPAFVYFTISMAMFVLVAVQNIGNSNMFNLGNFSCAVPNTILVFIVKILYILFWTWILNLMCKDGYPNIAWMLVLLPFILVFIVIAMIVVNQRNNKKETMRGYTGM